MELIRERKVVIAVAIALVVALLGARALTAGGDSAADPTGQRQVVNSRGQADDVTAKTLLQTAGVTMETLFAQNGSYAAGATGAATIEPNVVWVAGRAAQAAANQVGVTADETTYVLSSTSASGTTFVYTRDAMGVVTKSCGTGCVW